MILVVDDDCDILSLVKQILVMEGMTAICATNAEDALRKLAEKTFHLMITDRNMPGLDGFALARKASLSAPLMPIVMMTGDLSPEIPRLAGEVGITKVLVKPIHVEVFLEVIRAVTGKLQEQTAQAANSLKHGEYR